MNKELVILAKHHFEELEKLLPELTKNPFYAMAKKQLDMAIGTDAPEMRD